MKAKRRRHDPEFKARVAIEALKGDKTIQELAKEFDIHPVLISNWKKALTEGSASIFERGGAKGAAGDPDSQSADLHAKINQLTDAVDFLQKTVETIRPAVRDRVGLIEKNHPRVSERRQCALLGVARSTANYQIAPESEQNLHLKKLLGEIYQAAPELGSRQLVDMLLREHNLVVNRKRVQRLRRELGHDARKSKRGSGVD